MSDLRHKCVLLIIDGLGDLPVPELDNLTPLEAARTPVLDRLATAGQIGLLDPVGPGVVPNTHSGCGMLLGVLPGETDHMKRGPVEAAGAGRVLRPGEIAFRANFATLEKNSGGLLVSDRRAGRIDSDTEALAEVLADVDLGDGIRASLHSTDQHRCVLVLNGPGLEAEVSDTDPGDGAESPLLKTCRPLKPQAAATADKINDFVTRAHTLLQAHPINSERVDAGKLPANGVITRGAGAAFELENILHNRGVRTAVVAGCNTVRGMARILGFEALSDARFTASFDTDLDAKMAMVLEALESYDMVYLHIKAPDLFAHDKHPRAKRDFLERLDLAMSVLVDSGAMIALSADHTTDSNSGSHTADPVPVLLYDPAAEPDGNGPVNFGERACTSGTMPRQRSHDFLLQLVARMGF